MSTLEELEREMNGMLLQGQVMEAFEKFTTEDVVMIEPNKEPFVGKDLNRKREMEFFAMVEQFHGNELVGYAVGDGVSYSEWRSDVTFKGGHRMTLEQVERRRWRDGKVYEVRFYYHAMGDM